MPKFLAQASYTAEGLRGLAKDTASRRHDMLVKAFAGIGAKLFFFGYAFGADDVIAIADCPDNVTAAAISLTIAASGLVRIRLTPLLSVEEVDLALKKGFVYQAPGAVTSGARPASA